MATVSRVRVSIYTRAKNYDGSHARHVGRKKLHNLLRNRSETNIREGSSCEAHVEMVGMSVGINLAKKKL